jgi:hypothetical protein
MEEVPRGPAISGSFKNCPTFRVSQVLRGSLATKDVISAHSTPRLDNVPRKMNAVLVCYRENTSHLAEKLSANYPAKRGEQGVNGLILWGSLSKRAVLLHTLPRKSGQCTPQKWPNYPAKVDNVPRKSGRTIPQKWTMYPTRYSVGAGVERSTTYFKVRSTKTLALGFVPLRAQPSSVQKQKTACK